MSAVLNFIRCSAYRPSIHVLNYVQTISTSSTTKGISSTSLLKYTGINPQLTINRTTFTFLLRTSADQLWKGVTSVSPAGRKKGRAKGLKKRIRDLNRGQVIGFGDKNMLWPGLNSPVIRGHEVLKQQELPPDDSRKQRIYELRDNAVNAKSMKLTPLERGWSGTKLPGRTLGPPDPVGDETFEGFDSRVLQFKAIFKMSGERGRVKSMRAFVVVGNKNGLGGYALARSPTGMTAANNAKNRAAKALRYFPRDENRTIVHDFHSQFGATMVVAFKKPAGYGLCCHRVIKSICEVVGIKDLFAKVHGAHSNEQSITKAFFIGLMRQKPLQAFADEKRLHVVELRKDRDYYPEVVASPSKCRTKEEIGPYENLDFFLHVHDEKVQRPRRVYVPHYINDPGHIRREKYKARFRNHRDVEKQLVLRHGELTSFIQLKEKEKAEKAAIQAMEKS